jgi:hypothetical protein
MRILIVSDCTRMPEFSTLFLRPWEWALFVRDMYPNAFFDVLMPEKDKYWGQYNSTKYENQERIRIHFVPMISTGGIQQTMIATRELYELFNVSKTMYYYDAIFNPMAIFSPVLKKVLKPRFVKHAIDIPIFNRTGSVRTTIPLHNLLNTDYGEADVLAETIGWLTDYSVFMCGAERDMAHANCVKYLAGSQIKRFRKSSMVAPMGGMNIEKLEKARKPKVLDPERGLCIFLGGRWIEGKKFTTVCDMIKKAYESGRKVYGVCTTPEDESIRLDDLRAKYPMIEFHHKCGRDLFYEKMQEGHIFLCFSKWEGFGFSWWEMLYSGMIGIFLDRDWNRSILPEWPYRAAKEPKMMPMLLHVIDNYEEAVKAVEVARGFLADEYNSKKVNRAIYEWMLQKTREHYAEQFGGKKAGSMKRLAQLALDEMGDGPHYIEDIYRKMETKVRNPNMVMGRKGAFLSRMFLRQAMQFMGWRDKNVDGEPLMEKGDPYEIIPA